MTHGHLPYYFLLFGISALSPVFDFHETNRTARSLLYVALAAILGVFAGTRLGWNDQEGYTEVYDIIAPFWDFVRGNSHIHFRMEYFYLLFNSILKTFSDNPLCLYLSAALICTFVNLYSFKKYSPYFVVSVVWFYAIYYFSGTMVAMRMGFAATLILFGMSYLAEKKWAVFIALLAAAALFHVSAVFVVFGLALYALNLPTRVLGALVAASFFLGCFSPVAHWLFKFCSIFSGSGTLVDNGLHYLGNEQFGYAAGVLRPTMLKQLFICLFAMKYRDALAQKLKYFDVLFVFYCASTIWRYVFNDVALFASRIGGLLSVGEPVIVASLLLLFRPSQRGWIAALCCIVAAGSFYLNSVTFDYPAYNSVLFGGTYWRDGYMT